MSTLRRVGFSDLIICAILGVTGISLIHGIPDLKPETAAMLAGLAGTLIGGAVLLVGNWINRYNDVRRRAAEEDERRAKLNTLIAGELVSVATAYIVVQPMVAKSLAYVTSNAAALVGGLGLGTQLPHGLPLLNNLGAELMVLEPPAIDALVTLQVSLAQTRTLAEDVDQRKQIGVLALTPLANGLNFDLEVLATCFERIAPTRRLRLPGKEPELASTLLRRLAQAPSK
jgi:hypothetical protein